MRAFYIICEDLELRFSVDGRLVINKNIVVLLEGVCFYQMYARETAQANGWKTLVSNSAKLVNIIQGYDYVPVLATTDRCVDAAVTGTI